MGVRNLEENDYFKQCFTANTPDETEHNTVWAKTFISLTLMWKKIQKLGPPGEVGKAGLEVAFKLYHKGLVFENREEEKVQSE